jgi:hypothetical protein
LISACAQYTRYTHRHTINKYGYDGPPPWMRCNKALKDSVWTQDFRNKSHKPTSHTHIIHTSYLLLGVVLRGDVSVDLPRTGDLERDLVRGDLERRGDLWRDDLWRLTFLRGVREGDLSPESTSSPPIDPLPPTLLPLCLMGAVGWST